jgi:hypothetical protein
MNSRRHVIHERTNIIPINKNLSTLMKETNPKNEYSLKQNFFDPSKSSPPNEFMIKLKMRMSIYNKNQYEDRYVDMKDDSLDKE